MSDRRLRVAVAAVAAAGAAVSAYLVSARYGATALACTTGGCETVQSSRYSELAGVPVALLGLAAFLAVGATALSRTELARAAGAALALAGVVFGAYLLVVQVAVIGAVCDWCLVSDALMTVLTALALLRLHPRAAAPAGRAFGPDARSSPTPGRTVWPCS